MPIEKLVKVTLYGLIRRRDQVIEGLQDLGCLHLIDLQARDEFEPLDHQFRNEVQDALKYLYASPVQNPNQHTRYTDEGGCRFVAWQTLENKSRREALIEERDHLAYNLDLLKPWGDFQLPPREHIGGCQLWFYQLPKRLRDELEHSDHVWTMVNEDRQFLYVVVICRNEPESMPVKPLTLDPRPLSYLKRRLEEVDEELETLHWQRVALTRWTTLLQRDLNSADDELARRAAVAKLIQDDNLFVLQAWVPKSAMEHMRDFCQRSELAIIEERPGWTESPPTLLKNAPAIAGAEGAVTFYMTPSYKAWDPTWVVFFSFVLFFSMIMSDAAYGLLLGLGLAVVWPRLGRTARARATRSLFLAIVVATVIYGVLIGSFFGGTPEWLEPYQLKLDGRPLMENRNAMMLLALTIGVFHLALANLITAWRYWGRWQALSSVGWAAALIGALSYGVTRGGNNRVASGLAEWLGVDRQAVDAVFDQGGWGMLVGGLAAVFLFSSSRRFLSPRPRDWMLRVVDGLMALLNASKAFGDSLSYLRLFALGLASAQLAVTFNNLAQGTMEVPGVGIVFAILIFIVGHGINLLLGIMGGVVHGLRLNCIEFFNWSLTEEGYPFRAFCKKAS